MDEWFRDWFDADYAALYAHRDAAEARRAVDLALEALPALGRGPVLDLACGAGRHLEVLREVNPSAFGADLSAELLGRAPGGLRGHLLRADMRHLPLRPKSLSGVCLWFTPFGYFDDDANEALLASLASLLVPGGGLVLDYLNAPQVRARLVPEDTVVREGLSVVSRRAMEGGRVVKRMTLTRLDTGAVREVRESVRVYEPPEVATMAARAGLRLVREAGGYDGAPAGPSAPRWIGFFST